MKLQNRIDRLESAMAARPAHDATATFAALVEALDRMAARKVAGCGTVQRELAALVASLEGGDNGNAAKAT
jgi:ribosomal protein S20